MREILPDLDRVDLVVTDPPYVVGLASTGSEPKVGGWPDLMNAATWYSAWLAHCRRLTAPDGAVRVFNSWRSFPALSQAAYQTRWPIQSPLVWDKHSTGSGWRGLSTTLRTGRPVRIDPGAGRGGRRGGGAGW